LAGRVIHAACGDDGWPCQAAASVLYYLHVKRGRWERD
jgi:hypothetical protein